MSSVRMVRFNSITLKAEPDSERNNKRNDPSCCEADFGFFYALCFLISIITFAADIIMHCWLAYLFHLRREILYFILTVTFIIVPSIVSTGFSMRWWDDTGFPQRKLVKIFLTLWIYSFVGISWMKTTNYHLPNHRLPNGA